MKNIIQKTIPFALWLGALALRKSIYLGSVIAPHFVIVTPLLGSFLSISSVCCTFVALTAFKLLFSYTPVTLGIPTLLAALSWSVSTNKQLHRSNIIFDVMLHLLLPLACIALFITHPVGNAAFAYSFYWVIPIFAWGMRYVTKESHSFIIALQSTFIAHATGSIVWLFTMPMTTEQWLALIPVVAIERLTIAGSSALLYEMGHICIGWIGRIKTMPDNLEQQQYLD